MIVTMVLLFVLFYHHVALDSLYISTGNDVFAYLRQAANRINVFILGQVPVAITR